MTSRKSNEREHPADRNIVIPTKGNRRSLGDPSSSETPGSLSFKLEVSRGTNKREAWP